MAEPKVDFDEYARNYEALIASQTSFFSGDSNYFAQYKVDLVKSMAPDAGRILEFGCGVGRNVEMLRQAYPGAEIAGCDVSVESLNYAQARNPGCRFLTNDELDRSRSYDVGLVSCVLHHIAPDQRDEALGVCRDNLRPGGRLIIFEHNPFNPLTRHLVNTCPFDADAILLYRRETERRLAAAGFQDVRSSYCLFFPSWVGVLRPLEKFMGWLPLGGQYVTSART